MAFSVVYLVTVGIGIRCAAYSCKVASYEIENRNDVPISSSFGTMHCTDGFVDESIVWL
jgi:hypothetical protein